MWLWLTCMVFYGSKNMALRGCYCQTFWPWKEDGLPAPDRSKGRCMEQGNTQVVLCLISFLL